MQQGIPDNIEALSPKQVHLIRSAYRVMGEKGTGNFSLQDVADRAGVSKAILPYYFGSKENLILLTMRWVLTRVEERIRAAIAGATTAEGKVSAALDAIFVGPEANREFYLTYLDLLGYAARVDSFGDVGVAFRDIINDLYADIIRQGEKEGVFRVGEVEEAAATMRAIIDGLFIQWVQERDWRKLHPRYREVCKRSVLTYLRNGAGDV
ncbi:TetR family transcriptional regulator [Rubrobacter taiwanensis]|uniref:TetR family transcriptional regulator n=1 Tax=Rubrobacter taiwanensis TaxID=185139 RepID=A0A4R1BCS5_9ACTN|nr:TetR family transcriptional regulator [Rubrobacter taiwanensis]TCJ14860.1 TetR family transcriptional regulator [Rubrobacter taiwanensis]